MMRRKPSARVAGAGVTHTALAVEDGLGWLFREQPTEDFGIDAHAEIVDGEDVRGRLLAIQIKSGESWFKEPGSGGWWFRPDADHVEYWLNHSLPVAVVLYHPETKLCHWQLVNRDTLVETSTGGRKLFVPEAHVLDASATVPLTKAAEGDPYELRLRDLRLARPWMEMLVAGTRLVVDFAEWTKKSSGRGSIAIGIDREDGKEPEELVTWHVAVGPGNYAEAVPKLFAWADTDVHEETYEDVDDDLYGGPGIRPYQNGAGEVDYYRLELALNDLGHAFLVVDKFATDGERQFTA